VEADVKIAGRQTGPKQKLEHQRERKSLKAEVVATGEHDLYYFDESGFSLTPSVPYGWQPVGERIELPSSKSQQFNVLGFMRHDGSRLDPDVFTGSIDSAVAIACIDNFCKQLSRPTTLVIDNAGDRQRW
jgi:hypothetical protein